jgi:N-acylglucosamine 2-epimerase
MAARPATRPPSAEALALYQRVQQHLDTPGALPPKWTPATRPMRGLAIPMIMTVTAQILRQALPDPAFCNAAIDRYIGEIRRYHMHPSCRPCWKRSAPNGEFLDHFDGRTLNPGHAIEAPGSSCRRRDCAATTPRCYRPA